MTSALAKQQLVELWTHFRSKAADKRTRFDIDEQFQQLLEFLEGMG